MGLRASYANVTYYFIVILIGSTCFGHYCAHHQELTTIMLITTIVISFCKDVRGSADVKLWFLVVYVRCEVLCHLVVDDNMFLLINRTARHHPNRTHDLHSGSQDHHPSTNLVQKTVCRNLTSNTPDDGRMHPETCRAKDTSINDLVASSWHFTLFHDKDARSNNPPNMHCLNVEVVGTRVLNG